jgi:hypothetical protein
VSPPPEHPIRRTGATKNLGLAYMKGYRVQPDGRVRGPRGFRKLTSVGGRLAFSIKTPDNKPVQIYAAQLHAFQLWGATAVREGVYVSHRDGDRTNLAARNLILTTRIRYGHRKLTANQVRYARKAYRLGRKSTVQLSRELGLGRYRMQDMLMERSYRWVEMHDHDCPALTPRRNA